MLAERTGLRPSTDAGEYPLSCPSGLSSPALDIGKTETSSTWRTRHFAASLDVVDVDSLPLSTCPHHHGHQPHSYEDYDTEAVTYCYYDKASGSKVTGPSYPYQNDECARQVSFSLLFRTDQQESKEVSVEIENSLEARNPLVQTRHGLIACCSRPRSDDLDLLTQVMGCIACPKPLSGEGASQLAVFRLAFSPALALFPPPLVR